MKFKKIFLIEIVIVFIFAFLAGYLGSYLENNNFRKSLSLDQFSSLHRPIIEQKKVIIQENQSIKQAIGQAKSDVVPIFSFKNETQSLSNGFALTRDGLIITLSSNLPSKSLHQIFIAKKTIPFQVLKRDTQDNLILIKLKGDGFQTSEFANKDNIQIGEDVFVLSLSSISSSSSNSSTSLNYIVNQGIISQIKSDTYFTNISSKTNLDGSPCFNDKGEFIGLAENQQNGDLIIIPFYIIQQFAGL